MPAANLSPMARPLALAVLASLLIVGSAQPAAADSYQRVYLMGAPTDYLYWSVDPTDPELDETIVHRTCGLGMHWGIEGYSKPCLRGISLGEGYTYNMYFLPGSLFDETVSWGPEDPLRFHLELDVESVLPYSVHLTIQRGTGVVESPAAAEVSPGVWEGSLPSGSPLDVGTVNLFGIRIRTQSERVSMTLRAQGASYVELPAPVAARSVPDMKRADASPSPGTFSTALRSLSFNDDQWEAFSFEGDLTESRELPVTLASPAAFVLAWVEAYAGTFMGGALEGDPDPARLTDSFEIELLRDGAQVEHGGNAGPRGMDALATGPLPAGEVTLRVTPGDNAEGHAYTAHVLAVYGSRTLRSMRWTFTEESRPHPLPGHRGPVAASCPASVEPVPITADAASVLVDVDWESKGFPPPKYGVRFSIPTVGAFPCSEAGTGDRVRLTIPGQRVAHVGATPAYDAMFYPPWDTVFHMEARYLYTPAQVS